MHVAIAFINIGDYHAARIRAAAEACGQRGWNLTAIQVTDDTLQHPWGDLAEGLGVPVETLLRHQPGQPINIRRPFSGEASAAMQACLERLEPDAMLIPGWSFSVAQSALRWCRKNQKIAVLASESNEFDQPRKWWREKLKSIRVRKFSSALVGGKSHARYLQKLGFDSAKIAYGYDVVNNDTFEPTKIRKLPKPHVKPYFLAVGRLIKKKNYAWLIDAYADYCQLAGTQAWDLILCGDGELHDELRRQVERLSLRQKVIMPGFLKMQNLLPYFAHAGCFVHPSTEEQWGLVINEAIAAALPVLVSKQCGCYEDLVSEGENGFGFDPTDKSTLVSSLRAISDCSAKRKLMGEQSYIMSKNFSSSKFGLGLLAAIDYASETSNLA